MEQVVLISIRAPVSGEQARRWVERQVDRLRDTADADGIGVGALWPTWHQGVGDWLVEIDLRGRDVLPAEDIALTSLVLDLHVLGLRPEVHHCDVTPQALTLGLRTTRKAA
jgi:hypothetical protein